MPKPNQAVYKILRIQKKPAKCFKCAEEYHSHCSTDICFLCNNPGHSKKDCKNKGPRCLNCRCIGHKSIACISNKKYLLEDKDNNSTCLFCRKTGHVNCYESLN